MKPYKILLFFLALFAVMTGISVIFPGEGIHVGNLQLRYIHISEVIPQNLFRTFDRSLSDSIPVKDTILQDTLTVQDSLAADTVTDAGAGEENIHRIEYPETGNDILSPFFKSLKYLKKKRDLIRILHYGDSQIEGDRISSYLRTKMQETFGGYGPGMLPAFDEHQYTISIRQSASDNWEKYLSRTSKLNHRRFGAMTYFSRFVPTDSNASSIHESWIRFRRSSLTYPNTRRFDRCRIFYGFNEKTVTAELYVKDSLLKMETLNASNNLNVIDWHFNSPPGEILIKFMGQDSPNIYGITLDGETGVAVDNIALRGSAGLEFTTMDLNFLSRMYKLLNAKLLILQFGVNVVPSPRTDYSYYEDFFYEQLISLKKMNPGLCIIVIGVTDMSRKVNGAYESYPNVGLIRDAQRNAAFKADCAFWDLYEAMGGVNSMKEWVLAKPPLARRDFTHFNDLGAEKVSEMFFNAFMKDYYDYLKNNSIADDN